MQGARVWVREKEQLLPATVNSCGDGTLVITTDYGEVRKSVHPKQRMQRAWTLDSSCTRAVSSGQWISISMKGRLIESWLWWSNCLHPPPPPLSAYTYAKFIADTHSAFSRGELEAMASFTKHACFLFELAVVCSSSRSLNVEVNVKCQSVSVCSCLIFIYFFSFYGQCELNNPLTNTAACSF